MICVDPLARRVLTGKFEKSCHLFSDDGDTEMLHEFAYRIGMLRAWFQPHVKYPHYDLTAFMREKAVGSGAVEVSRRHYVLTRKEQYNG